MISQVLAQFERTLRAAGIASARLDAQILLEKVTGRSRTDLLAHPEIELTIEQNKQMQALIQKRAQRTPLVHLTGTREFYGLELEVTPAVLTPRAETEKMAEWAIETAPPDSNLLDVGTGSGALAIAIKQQRPDLSVVAAEISSGALAVARRNAAKHKLNIEFVQSDLLDNVTGRYSTVVTNLPYLESGAELMPEVQREPKLALFGGADGLHLYRRFFAQISDHLDAHGRVYTECDPWQQTAMKTVAAKFGLSVQRADYFVLEFQAQ